MFRYWQDRQTDGHYAEADQNGQAWTNLQFCLFE
jgi:hypothetical protein